MTTTELLEAVKAHAMAHYEDDGGWDYIIEAFEDEELIEIIGKARTVKGAIRKVKWHADLLGERRQEVYSTIW